MKRKIYEALELILSTDAYKLTHRNQYPNNLNLVYSNLTPREIRNEEMKKIYVCGVESAINEMNRLWKDYFFSLSEKELNEVLEEYQVVAKYVLMTKDYEIEHFKKLWKEKKLSNVIDIRVIKDRTLLNVGVPILKMWNIKDDFFWLVNYLETYLLSNIWNVVTSSTKAYYLKELLDKYADKTSDNSSFTIAQARDFSYRGLSSNQSAIWSGIGHLYSFKGSSTIPAILKYNLDPNFKNKPNEWVGDSIPATEHSVMSSAEPAKEFDLYKDLLKKYPKGMLSIVSDTYDYWNVVDNYLPKLKEIILKREGKLIIRPDSGDYLKMCIGTIEKLWTIFGGTINKKGYKVLDPHIGIIYGDGVNYGIVEKVLALLAKEGFSSENIVFGMGGKTYQKSTRDLLGFSFKATYIEINKKGKTIFKDPVTEVRKKSAKGLLAVINGVLKQDVTWNESNNDDMIKVL